MVGPSTTALLAPDRLPVQATHPLGTATREEPLETAVGTPYGAENRASRSHDRYRHGIGKADATEAPRRPTCLTDPRVPIGRAKNHAGSWRSPVPADRGPRDGIGKGDTTVVCRPNRLIQSIAYVGDMRRPDDVVVHSIINQRQL